MIALLALIAHSEPLLENGDYRFCTEANAQAAEARDFCDLLDDAAKDRCPGLRATCESPEDTPPSFADFAEQMRGCDDAGSTPAAPPEPTKVPQGCDSDRGCESPPDSTPAVGAIRWAFAIVVAVFVLVLLRLLYAFFGAIRMPPRPKSAYAVKVTELPPDEIPDLPSADLLFEARRALQESRFGDAVVLCRGASLRKLGEVGRVVLHRARTDREYVRSVREAPLRDALREVVAAAEVHKWGGRLVDEDLARSALKAAERVIAAVVVLLALLLRPSDADASSRFGPYGDAAMLDLYKDAGYDASWRLRGLEAIDGPDVLVLDLWRIETTAEDNAGVLDFVMNGGILIVGGDASGLFPDLGAYTVDDHELIGVPVVQGPQITLMAAPRYPGGAEAWYDGPESNVRVWASTDAGGAVIAAFAYGAGGVVAISDARLLTNGALVSDRDRAVLLEGPMIGADQGLWPFRMPATLELATRGGADAEDPFTSLSNARMLPFVAQLAILGIIIGLWRGWPFGVPKDPPDEGRLAFSEHPRALGLRYARAGASGHALRAHARMWHQRLGRDGLVAAAIRNGYSKADAEALAGRIEEAVASDGRENRAQDDLRAMEDLWRITEKH